MTAGDPVLGGASGRNVRFYVVEAIGIVTSSQMNSNDALELKTGSTTVPTTIATTTITVVVTSLPSIECSEPSGWIHAVQSR